MALSCKLRFARSSARLRFQDRAECGNSLVGGYPSCQAPDRGLKTPPPLCPCSYRTHKLKRISVICRHNSDTHYNKVNNTKYCCFNSTFFWCDIKRNILHKLCTNQINSTPSFTTTPSLPQNRIFVTEYQAIPSKKCWNNKV